jgi:methionyl aminopeptidase
MVSLPGLRNRKTVPARSPGELDAMAAAGAVVAAALRAVERAAGPGVTTGYLDDIAETVIREAGGTPSFLGYHGFPASICSSVNERVVHGIPTAEEVLAFGDLVSIDCGAIVDGWHGDAAVSVLVGAVTAEVAELSRVTEASMWAGLAKARAGGRLSDIGHAVEQVIIAAGDYGIVEEYVGHGIGTSMHMHPPVPNYGKAGQGPHLKVGMALAIEPMVCLGGSDVGVLSDGWTVVTSDQRYAAHWEHTVAITEDGPWVLTAMEEVRL